MADQPGIAAPFPAPPPFYKHFTKNKREDLTPPDPPTTAKFLSFGVECDLNEPDPTLASGGIEQLYPGDPNVHLNPQPHLIDLARSLLTTFLSLTGILSQNPELYEERVADLQTIMYNMHDLINRYRPHQARESLILLMEERVETMRSEIRTIDESRDKVAKLLQGLQEGELAAGAGAGSEEGVDRVDNGAVKKRREKQRGAWIALESAIGSMEDSTTVQTG